MSISIEEVLEAAKLARLELAEEEVVQFQGELDALLGHFRDIQDLSEDDVLDALGAELPVNVWAPDLVVAGLRQAMALRSAPRSRAGLFIVPTVLED
ncbi:MAG: Asp-tRNA(Asn)/Glu-tRNA(Gln) amidotransferase subunit GatC [Fimbriimonadaceae bacterium]